jgi:hypothetical protein
MSYASNHAALEVGGLFGVQDGAAPDSRHAGRPPAQQLRIAKGTKLASHPAGTLQEHLPGTVVPVIQQTLNDQRRRAL